MKRYITVDHTNATREDRRAIREPQVREMNERPRDEFMQIEMMDSMMAAPMMMQQNPMSFGNTFMNTYRMVFESVCFTTLYWMEVEVRDNVSHGFYHEMRSYCQVPQNVELSDIPMMQQGAMFDTGTADYHLSDEQYYRHRIRELEDRLNTVEQTRTIVPQEEINNIHDGLAVVGDKPIPAQYFDEEIFTME